VTDNNKRTEIIEKACKCIGGFPSSHAGNGGFEINLHPYCVL